MFMGVFGIMSIPEQSLPSALREYKTAIRLILLAFTCLNLIIYALALVHFVIFKARNPTILFLCGLFFSTTLMRGTMYILILWNRTKLTTLIDDLEEVIEKSKRFFYFKSSIDSTVAI